MAADTIGHAKTRELGPITIIGDGPLAGVVRAQGEHGLGMMAGQPVLVIDHGQDVLTIAALRQALDDVQKAASRPVIIAQIGDRRLRRAVQARLEESAVEPRPHIVDASGLAAEHFVLAEHLFELAYWRNQQRFHAALIGFDCTGQSFLDALPAAGIAGELQLPLIHIITTDEAGTRAFLRREMPEIDKSAEIIISAYAMPDLGDPESSPLVEAEESAPLTAILLLLEKEGDTLLASAAIANLQDRHGFANAALYIGGAGSDEACALTTPMRLSRNLGRKIARIDDLAMVDSLVDYVLRRRDALAKLLHESYLREFGGKTAGGTPWDTLPETYRRANRRAASHLAQKLWTMGLSVPDDALALGTIDPFTYDNTIRPLFASATEDETVRRLARLEHERWCADRRLDGWRHGNVRDDTQRQHPNLVTFDDPRLTVDDIAKDIVQIRSLLKSMLHPTPGGAAPHFILGVTATAAGVQPGVPLVAAVDQLAAEPHRSTIVVSPLLDERELKATSTLVAILEERARNFKLIVPEWYPGNKNIRKETVASSPALQSLLNRQQTRIAPIGPAGICKDDAWESPADSDAAREALARYVGQRAHALIAFE